MVNIKRKNKQYVYGRIFLLIFLFEMPQNGGYREVNILRYEAN